MAVYSGVGWSGWDGMGWAGEGRLVQCLNENPK